MLGKFRDDWGFVLPLVAHVGVHAVFTFCIASIAVGIHAALPMALFDGVVHFTMDRVKASRRMLGRFKPLTSETAKTATPEQWKSNSFFWWSVGLDQGVHHLTHYAIIAWILYLRGQF